MTSLQKFAAALQITEKKGSSTFRYGRIGLNELLYFRLPRRAPATLLVATFASCPTAPATASSGDLKRSSDVDELASAADSSTIVNPAAPAARK
jgi:hypothetical protein